MQRGQCHVSVCHVFFVRRSCKTRPWLCKLAATFVVNNGEYEALQFDDALNTGLYVTNDIDAIDSSSGSSVAERMPKSEFAIEVWFTLEKENIVLGGLAGAMQDAGGCALGWGLTYDRRMQQGRYLTTYFFRVALQPTDKSSKSILPPSFVQVQHTADTELFVWTHLVATYNGSHLAIHLDGVESALQMACHDPHCGDIHYSTGLGRGCLAGSTTFTLGTVDVPFDNFKYPHQGLLRHIRILSMAVQGNGVAMLYQRMADQMKFTAPADFEYWVKASSLPDSGLASPSIDMVHAESPAWLTARGNFSSAREYRCKMTFGDHSMYSKAVAGCSVSYQGGEGCAMGFADEIKCQTPPWRAGFGAARLSVLKWLGNGNSSGSEGSDVGMWKPLLQRVCLRKACGYRPLMYRYRAQVATTFWYTSGDRNLLHPTLSGRMSYIRTMTPGAIYRVDPAAQRITRVSTFMTGGSDARGTPLRNRYIAAGVSHYSHVEVGGQHYLIGATAWDGKGPNTTSGLYHFDESTGQLKLLQEIDTYGARKWIFFRANESLFAAVANYHGNSVIYRCRATLEVPPMPGNSNASAPPSLTLETGSALHLNVTGASSMIFLATQHAHYILVSTFFQGLSGGRASPSVLYRITAGAHGHFTAQVVQQLAVTHAADVTDFLYAGVRHVIFAVNQQSSPSLTFSMNMTAGAEQGAAVLECCGALAPTLPTQQATSLDTFDFNGKLVVLAAVETSAPLSNLIEDTQVGAKMMVFNGSHFIGKSDPGTLPRDSAGGQFLNLTSPTTNRQLVHVRTGNSLMLLAGNFKHGDDGYSALQILTANEATIEGLVRPTSIAVGPNDGKYVYVASHGSQAVAVFSRDIESGDLSPATVLMRPEDMTGTSLGGIPSFRGLRHIAISPDQRHMYATVTDAVVVMDVSAPSGAVRVTDFVADGSITGDGEKIEGLQGAFSVHVSADGAAVYVSSYSDGALVAFSRNSSDGSLSFVDVMQDGERLLGEFQDLELADNSEQNVDWSPKNKTASAPYPRTIPLGQSSVPPRDIKMFGLEGRRLMAVASSSPSWDVADGTFKVFEWQGDALTGLCCRSDSRPVAR